MYYLIKTVKGYLTHKGMYTTNINFAYTFDDVKEVQAIIKSINITAEIVTKKSTEEKIYNF